MAAAVADFRPRETASTKLGREQGLTLELEPTEDILAGVAAAVPPLGDPRRPILVGFAAETGSLERAADKLVRKGVDFLVANDVAEEGSGFGTDTNHSGSCRRRRAGRPAAALEAGGGRRDPRPRRRGAGRARRPRADWAEDAGDQRVSANSEIVRRLTVGDIAKLHGDGRRIAMLTAYDYPTAKLLDEAGSLSFLVGDSLGRAMLGYENEIPVSMADMLHHTAAVTRGAKHALVVATCRS